MPLLPKIFKPRSEQEKSLFIFLKDTLGFAPHKLYWYKVAFTHSSANETDSEGHAINYERMEFLGDAVISAIISAYLLEEVPFGNEGYLTQMRSKIVSRKHLNELGKELNLLQHTVSNIPKTHQGDNIHGNLFEAFVGAIYMDKGYPFCEKFIQERVIYKHVNLKELDNRIMSYKSLMIEWCQKQKKLFKFEILEDNGKENIPYFSVKFYVDNKIAAKARATSKKKAEEKAARRAYFAYQDQIQGSSQSKQTGREE